MSDVIAPVAPVAAAPDASDTTIDPGIDTEVEAVAPVDDGSEEYVLDGEKVKLSKKEARDLIEKAAASGRRFQDVAKLKDEVAKERQAIAAEKARVEAMLEDLKKDPEAVAAKLGMDWKEIIAKDLARKAQEQALSPEQLEMNRIKAELEQFKTKELTAKQQAEQQAQDAQQKAEIARIDKALTAAAEKHGLDFDPDTLDMMFDEALKSHDLGLPLDPDEVAVLVKSIQVEQAEAFQKKVWAKMTVAQKVEWVGPEFAKQLMAESLKAQPRPTLAPKAKPIEAKRGIKTEAEEKAELKRLGIL